MNTVTTHKMKNNTGENVKYIVEIRVGGQIFFLVFVQFISVLSLLINECYDLPLMLYIV